MSYGPNFVPITEIQVLTRRDFPLADPTLLAPFGANPLVDGEWLELDVNYHLQRGTGAGIIAVYPVFTERGRYDTQALGKADVFLLGQYEAETKVVNMSSLVLGSVLMVGDVTYMGATKRGLLLSTGGSGVIEVGYVTKINTTTSTIRFVHTSSSKHA